MTFNKVNISCVEDLVQFANFIERGSVEMPNISKLARELGKNRRTIRNALQGNIPSKTRNRKSYLDDYRDEILKLLKDDFRKFEYYQHLYNYMKREFSITCSYSSFKRYIQNDEQLSKCFKNKDRSTSFTKRFETNPGLQAQFDLKERISIIDVKGNKSKINVATLTFGYSRYNIRKIVYDTSYNTVIDFLAESFEKIGGVVKELVIDNIKCLVDKPRTSDSDAILNAKFIEFAKDYNIEVKPCMPYRPETKGKTETQNKVPSQIKNYNGTYKDISDVHRVLDVINDEDNSKISQATGFPSLFLLEKEKEELQTLPSKIIQSKYYLTLSEVMVTRESMISYKSCKYSVPKSFIGKKIGRRVKNDKLHLYYNNKIITVHQITDKKININPAHELEYDIKTKIDEKEVEKETKILEEMKGVIYDNS